MSSITFDYSTSYKAGIDHSVAFIQSLGLAETRLVSGLDDPSFATTATTQFEIGGVSHNVLVAIGQNVPGAEVFISFASQFSYPITNYLPTTSSVALLAKGDIEAGLVFSGVFPVYPSATTVAPYIQPSYAGSTESDAVNALLADVTKWLHEVIDAWVKDVGLAPRTGTSADFIDAGGLISHLTFGAPAATGLPVTIANLSGSGFVDAFTVRGQTVIGTSYSDHIQTGIRPDLLNGGDGNDSLDGGAGADTMVGGLGDDFYVVDDAGDVVTENPGEGNDTIGTRINNYVLPEGLNVENLALLGTVVGTGNSGGNHITGTFGNNILAGLGGADTIDGGLGTDIATYAASAAAVNVSLATGSGFGGDADGDILNGIEWLVGSAYNDTLAGDAGDNSLTGGGGTDTVSYEHAALGVTVTLAATGPQDTIGAGIDKLSGFENITGSASDDTLTGNQLTNVLIGGAGNDTLEGGGGADTLIGGTPGGPLAAANAASTNAPWESDTATYAASAAAVNVSLATGKGQGGDAKGDTLIDIENLTGSDFNDVLTGNGQGNVLIGGTGDDSLAGGAGDDTLEGGIGNNLLNGGDGVDTASYEHAGSGVTVNLTIATAQNTGGAGNDRLASIENVTGSAHGDTLTGNQLANVLIGGAGNDTIDGGAGNDTLRGDTGTNTFVFGVNFGHDTIKDFQLMQDVVRLTFPQASKFVTAAAVGDDGLGNARFVVNASNTITFLGISPDALKAHLGDFQVV
jgi:Ca2+-binding RTX toxin-like protein